MLGTCDLLGFQLVLVWVARKRRELSILGLILEWSALFYREKFLDSNLSLFFVFRHFLSNQTLDWFVFVLFSFPRFIFLNESFYGMRDDDIIIFGFMR